MKAHLQPFEEKMTKTMNTLAQSFAGIRAGRATAAVLDKVSVDYYGVPTAITSMAAVSVPEARMLVIQPWDKSTLKPIEKAILASDIGINPNNDGTSIRLAFPPLTEERRKELSKKVSKYSEEAKVSVRNIRRDALEKFKAMKKNSEITEDDQKVYDEDAQKLTDKFIKEIDKLCDAKEKEIMEI